jgi:DNA (cytosine-5)-methyltransferase 1
MTSRTPSDASEALDRARELYSQKELAHLLERNPRTVARWENGEVPIPFAVVPALRSVAFRTTVGTPGDFSFVDLFAGIGGMRIGFEAHGGRCIFTSEWDAYCQKSYRANFPSDEHTITGDITKVDEAEIPDHDVLLAGFPCQPFSLAGVSKKNALGRPHGFECATQGTLFFDVARIIARKRPRAFLLENVKNLLSHDGGNTFAVIRHTLESQLKYQISWRVIDGRHFAPQHRERILIVGFREKTKLDWDVVPLPEAGSERLRLRTVLHTEDGQEADCDQGRYICSRGRVQPKYVLTDRLWDYLQRYAEKHRAKGNGFGCSVVGRDDVARTLSARYYKDGSEILIDRGPNKNPRRLTPRECARLMGFPETFKIVVSDTRAYKQFCNSVVVPLIRHVASLMKPGIMESKARDKRAAVQTSLF